MKKIGYFEVAYCLLVHSILLGASSQCDSLVADSSKILPEVQVISVDLPVIMGDSPKTYFMHSISSLAYSPDGSKLAFVTNAGAAYAHCAQTGKLIYELKPSTARVVKIPNTTMERLIVESGHDVRFSPDGMQIAAGFNNGEVYMWDSTNGELRNRLIGREWAISLAFNPKISKQIAAGYASGAGVYIWDIAAKDVVRTLQRTDRYENIESLDYSADGELLASASTDCTVQVWSTATWQCLHRLDHGGHHVYAVRFDPCHSVIASGTYKSGVIRLWDARSGACLKTLRKKCNNAQVLALSRSGTMIASDSNKKIELFDAARGSDPHEIELHEMLHRSYVNAIAFAPNDKTIAVAAGYTIQFLPLS